MDFLVVRGGGEGEEFRLLRLAGPLGVTVGVQASKKKQQQREDEEKGGRGRRCCYFNLLEREKARSCSFFFFFWFELVQPRGAKGRAGSAKGGIDF